MPNLNYEKSFWKRGIRLVFGADEVGRGSFAGPVVASAVALAPNFKSQITNLKLLGIRIDDSKKLTAKQREKSVQWIKKNVLTWAIGEVSAKVIDKVGITKATQMAFRRAIYNAQNKLSISHQSLVMSHLLVDAFYVPYLKGFPKFTHQKAIVQGDSKVFSIAAASIVAKVYRDRLMISLSKKPSYRKYMWEQNKGYGTKFHRQVIQKYGLTRYHRKSFV